MLKNIIKTKRYVVVQTKLAILSIKKKFKPIKINIKKRVELKKTRNKKLIKLMKAGFTRWIKSIKLDLKKKTKEERIKHNNYKARRSRKLARFWIKKSNEAEKQVKELKERKKKELNERFINDYCYDYYIKIDWTLLTPFILLTIFITFFVWIIELFVFIIFLYHFI